MRQLGSAIRINFSDCERSGPTGLELFGENLNQEFESMIDHNIEDSAVSYLGMCLALLATKEGSSIGSLVCSWTNGGGWMSSVLGSSVSFVTSLSFSTTGGGIGGPSYETSKVVIALASFLGVWNGIARLGFFGGNYQQLRFVEIVGMLVLEKWE
ncbi:hypothetical protein Tco_1466626 [Tanacetum coccineum]|uniref:Uncharacterized protein n=1 Tax=Tanacetum coccineum TaxID=301880 RepID=A0ABQ5JFA6_9ASTR